MSYYDTFICAIIISSKERASEKLGALFACKEGGVVADVKELAETDYLAGMKYKDIAAKYNVSLNTVKSWQKRYGWSRKKGAPKKAKRVHPKRESSNSNMQGEEADIEELVENSELTDGQRLFCVYYLRSFNATKAYMKAYDCTYEAALAAGSRMLRNVKVQDEIKKLKQGRLNRELLTEEDIIQKYIDILYADINDYVDEQNNICLDNPFADGTLIKKVSFGSTTNSVELLDKQKALQWLADHMDFATVKQKAEIALLQAKVNEQSGDGTQEKTEAIDNIQELLEQVRPIESDEAAK